MKQPLTRSRGDKFIAGVCGGVARSLGLDSGLIRVVAVLLALFTQVGWVAYLVLWAVLPLEEGGPTGIDEVKAMFNQNRSGGSGTSHDPANPTDLR